MVRAWALACLPLVALLSGCLHPAPAAAPGPTPPAFAVPAPEWQPGFSWWFGREGEQQTASFTVARWVSLGGRVGVVGVAGEEGRLSTIQFVEAGSLRLSRLFAHGNVTQACTTPPEAMKEVPTRPSAGPLEFPLAPGKTWRPIDDGRLVNEYRVAGAERVEVPAGAFDAVRVEVHAWRSDPALAEWSRAQEQDEEGARRHGPVAVLHYAEAARSIVRVAHPGPIDTDAADARQPPPVLHPLEILGGAFLPHDPQRPLPQVVTSLAAHTLEQSEPWSTGKIVDAVEQGLCTRLQAEA
jgi:hypothetical protein